MWLPMVLMGISIWEQRGQAPGNPSDRYLQGQLVFIHYPQDSPVNGIEEPLMTIKSEKFQWRDGRGFPARADARQNWYSPGNCSRRWME